jgi:hypothetical protein
MKTPLVGNPYQGRSPIASAQRAVNLYAESNAALRKGKAFSLYNPDGY